MKYFVSTVGSLVLCSVIGIFVFIFFEVLPLTKEAQVTELETLDVPKHDYSYIHVDELGRIPTLLSADGKIISLDRQQDNKVSENNILNEERKVSIISRIGDIKSKSKNVTKTRFIAGYEDGQFTFFDIESRSISIHSYSHLIGV